MPEGDTVRRTAHRLNRALAGRVLTSTDFRVPAHATVDLSGSTVTEVRARGKHLLTRTTAGVTLHTHLRMEGSWHLYRHGSRWRGPDHQIRVVLANSDWVAVGFRLGAVDLVSTSDEATLVGHLGPDLLGGDWAVDEAARRLLSMPQRPVGEALLDQRNLAGIGNLYMAELCFLVGVHPRTPIDKVSDLNRMLDRGQKLLQANTTRSAQTTTGDTRRGQTTWVYERSGKPCRRCGTAIASALQGEPLRERVAYWCPSCQPEPEG